MTNWIFIDVHSDRICQYYEICMILNIIYQAEVYIIMKPKVNFLSAGTDTMNLLHKLL